MLQITLRQADGTDKTYTQSFISGRMFRRTVEIQKLMRTQSGEPETLLELYQYMSESYGGQFTAQEFEDGVDSRYITETIRKHIANVTGQTNEAIGADGKADPN